MFLHFLMCPIRALWPWCLFFPDCSSLTKKALRGVKVNVGSLYLLFDVFLPHDVTTLNENPSI